MASVSHGTSSDALSLEKHTCSSYEALYAPSVAAHPTDYDHPPVALSPYTAEHYVQIPVCHLSLFVSSAAARVQQRPNTLMARHHCLETLHLLYVQFRYRLTSKGTGDVLSGNHGAA